MVRTQKTGYVPRQSCHRGGGKWVVRTDPVKSGPDRGTDNAIGEGRWIGSPFPAAPETTVVKPYMLAFPFPFITAILLSRAS